MIRSTPPSVNPPRRGNSRFFDQCETVPSGGKGALEISSNQLLSITSRTYNEGTAGTTGQSYDGFTTEDGVAAGQSVYMTQLTENSQYRCNILVANTGSVGTVD